MDSTARGAHILDHKACALAFGAAAGLGALGVAVALRRRKHWELEAGAQDPAVSGAGDPGDTNRVPPRPVTFALRPHNDPRVDPSLYVRYDPFPKFKTGAIMIVIPGGNYEEVGVNCGEGQPIAQWLAGLGITAVVLEYRLVSRGHYWPAQFEDWTACAQAIRKDAASWGCDPERIGVIGFSAGGHLAGYAALRAAPEVRPRLQVLIYPAVDPLSPYGDGDMDAWQADRGFPPIEAGTHRLVHPGAPPAFLAGVCADTMTPIAENSDVYERVLKEHGVPVEHVRNEDPDEEHGCGLKEWWSAPCEEWLRKHGWARSKASDAG